MVVKNYLLLFVSILSFACNEKEGNKFSRGKLNKETMVSVLFDIHVTEASYSILDRKQTGTRKRIEADYAAIFKKHRVDAGDFFKTYEYYLNHAELLDTVYSELVARITTRQGQLQSGSSYISAVDTSAYRDSIKSILLKKLKRQ